MRDPRVRAAEEDGWQLTEALLAALMPDLDCLFLCTPNNPTGLLPESHLLAAIAARCKALDIRADPR
nr:L-threonine 3-O-phosphate decarboxylase [Raoultella sp. NCTC 9187]